MMQTLPLYFLLVAVNLPVFMAMPEPMDGPGRFMYPGGNNMTEPPAGDLEAYCQMLLQGPVPLPPDQIPWFCLCTHCQSKQGPKGDRGDRGPPGKCFAI